jgi:hypothetical protein
MSPTRTVQWNVSYPNGSHDGDCDVCLSDGCGDVGDFDCDYDSYFCGSRYLFCFSVILMLPVVSDVSDLKIGSTASSSSTVIAGNQGLDSGSIAGIVIGVVVGVVVLIWMCKPITNKRSEKLSSVSSRSSRGSRRRSTVVM